jgi:hypothetical protein
MSRLQNPNPIRNVTQIQSEMWKPQPVRPIGSAVWEDNADPTSNVGTTISKANWERQHTLNADPMKNVQTARL